MVMKINKATIILIIIKGVWKVSTFYSLLLLSPSPTPPPPRPTAPGPMLYKTELFECVIVLYIPTLKRGDGGYLEEEKTIFY